jgi:hypothetical protein
VGQFALAAALRAACERDRSDHARQHLDPHGLHDIHDQLPDELREIRFN